jgi:serine/arginine repetitive matrix protein 2
VQLNCLFLTPMEPPTPAEQRAFAVARIKRSTSLPRMKDGRRPRPPMHVEAVSEGERPQSGRHDEGVDAQLSDDSPVMSEAQGGDDTRRNGVEPEPEVDTEHSETKVDDPKTEEEPIISPPATPSLPGDTPTTKSRRRSRSRSRRGSKDFKSKAKATQSPNPTNTMLSANDSSPDEGPLPSTSHSGGFTSPPLISPIPAHFALLQAQRILASPEPGMIYPGTSPPTPMLPTLQDIQREALQRGLFRSNSAAARLMALQQLAGPGAYDPSLASPPVTPPPLPGKMFRNNTVGGGGGERIAARKVMLRQLNKRLKEAEAEHTSGGEDPQPVIRSCHSCHKRPQKRDSVSRPTVVDDRDDREPSAASPTTPVLQSTALPPTPETTHDECDTHTALPARSPTPNARSPSVERSREDALAKLTGEPPPAAAYGYGTALERRGPVVEEEDDAPDHDHDQASPIPRSTYNGRSDTPPQIPSPRSPHPPGTFSGTSAESADGGVPAYTPTTAHEQQHEFPTSPFATPLRERQGPDEEEEDSHTEDESARRSPWNDAYDREISWVAELGKFLEYDVISL